MSTSEEMIQAFGVAAQALGGLDPTTRKRVMAALLCIESDVVSHAALWAKAGEDKAGRT